MRLAKYIADFLVENGITDMFTVTGGGAMFLNDAFGHKDGLKCIYNHHEQACTIAAEGYFRSNGRMPAVCVTTGPGGSNALTGVLGAWLDSIPMLIISGQIKFSTSIKCTDVPLRQLGDQEFNITDCVKAMSKYAVMVTDPLTIKYHLKKALYIATHGRPGPVWLDIPINVQSADIEPDKLLDYDVNEDKDILPPKPDKEDISELVKRLKSAKRPVILAGGGIKTAGLKEDFLRLVKKFNIPVQTAWNAHDLLPDSEPHNCGRPGTIGTRGGNFVLQNSDFVLSLGCRMNIRQISYNYENFAKDAFLAAVDIDRAELFKPTLNIGLKIHADLRDVFPLLMECDFSANEEQLNWLKRARETDLKYSKLPKEFYEKKTPVNPYVFVSELGKKLIEGESVVLSNGSACVCPYQAMEFKDSQVVFTNSGCASMGYGLPAAIGAAVAMRGKRIICLEGDGSVQMNIQELQTVKHNNLNIKLFWLNNEGYHSIRQTQVNAFNSNFCGVAPDSGVSFPEAERIAYAYGIKYFKIDNQDNIGDILDRLLAFEGACLCEVVLDKKQFFVPKLSSKTMPDGTIVSPSLENMYPFLSEEENIEIINYLRG